MTCGTLLNLKYCDRNGCARIQYGTHKKNSYHCYNKNMTIFSFLLISNVNFFLESKVALKILFWALTDFIYYGF